MKKILIISALFCSLSVHAQFTSFEAPAAAKEKQSKEEAPATAKEKPVKEKPAPIMMIDEKYAAGACPTVNGKVEWGTTIDCNGLMAQQVYDRMIEFLVAYCKEKGKDPESRIAIVNKTTHEIGARIKEYVVFKDHSLMLDRTLMSYTLRVACFDGKCEVTMKGMSYRYDSKSFPAEDMLLDENALNKTKTDFRKGGFRKFRTRTIDAKDTLFARIAEALNQ